jgi:hypothetical protein
MLSYLASATLLLLLLLVPACQAQKHAPRHFWEGEDHSKDSPPVTERLCGCTAGFTVTKPNVTWLSAVQGQYPGLEPRAAASGVLALCNPQAALVPSPGSTIATLAPGQILQGICTSIHGKSLQQFLDNGRQEAARLTVASRKSQKVTRDGPGPGRNVTNRSQQGAAPAKVPRARLESDATCAISWSEDTPVRTVMLSNSCPVYDNGCSGPSDALAHQDKLRPCCQAHDW